MKDEANGALKQLKEIASRRDDGIVMCLWSEEARAILAHIAALEARAEAAERLYQIEYDIVGRIWQLLGDPSYEELGGRSIYDLITELKTGREAAETRAERAEADCAAWRQAGSAVSMCGETTPLELHEWTPHELSRAIQRIGLRAEAAEAKVAAAEERGLVFLMLPDGRLDSCAIRVGSRLWEARVRAEDAEAREAELRAALEKARAFIESEYQDPAAEPEGEWLAAEARPVHAVICQALAATSAAPVLPRLNIRCETTDGHVTGSTYLNVVRIEAEDDGSFTAVTDHWPATYAASARKMEQKDD